MPSIQNVLLSATFAAFVAAQQQSDGQVTASTSVAPASQVTDGQIQVTTSAPVAPVSQITDGQIQVTTSAPVAPVSQITDGQIQVTTAAPVAPVSQISDGQIQVTTAAPASQISDGQIQIPTTISTGVMAPSPNGTTVVAATATPSAFTGAANIMAWSKEIAVVAVGAAAGLVML